MATTTAQNDISFGYKIAKFLVRAVKEILLQLPVIGFILHLH